MLPEHGELLVTEISAEVFCLCNKIRKVARRAENDPLITKENQKAMRNEANV